MYITPEQLAGSWLHSHEEDTATERVYRRSDFDFPPSRGRDGYEFLPGQDAKYIGIAARDGAVQTTVNWRLRTGEQPEIMLTLPNGQQRVLQIVSVDQDRLIIKKPLD
jgi:hypothetical protein